MQDQNFQPSVTLIYYNFRGMAQVIRYVLLYLNIPFNQLLLKNGQLPSSLDIVKKLNYQGQLELPCLVHGKFLIQNCFAIIRHLCTHANRQDILGSTLQQKAVIRQIFYSFLQTKNKSIKLLFKFGQQAAKNPNQKQEVRKKALQLSHRESGSLLQTAKLKAKNPHQKFIFNHITILDFLFYEESFYQINLFGNLEKKNCKILETINSIFGTELTDIKDKSVVYLRLMREFKENFEKDKFYIGNKDKIESYSVITPCMNNVARQAFKNVWLGQQNFLK